MSCTTAILLIQYTKVKLGQEVLKLLIILETCKKFVFQSKRLPNNKLTSYLSWLAGNGNGAISVVFDRRTPFLHQCPIAGTGVKRWDSCSSCSNTFSERTLWENTFKKQ